MKNECWVSAINLGKNDNIKFPNFVDRPSMSEGSSFIIREEKKGGERDGGLITSSFDDVSSPSPPNLQGQAKSVAVQIQE